MVLDARFIEKEKMKDKFVKFKKIWVKYSTFQKIALISLIVFTLIIPMSALVMKGNHDLRSRASENFVTTLPITGPISVTPSQKNHLTWSTNYVSLEAENFYIVSNGNKYYANTNNVSLNSDPPDPPDTNYTTLEAIWTENSTEMRLFMYFYRDENTWWLSEARIYNGQSPGDWIYFNKNSTSKLINGTGEKFLISLDLNSDPDQQYQGRIHFDNLKLQPFLNSLFPTTTPTAVSTLTPTITPPPSLNTITVCPDGAQNQPECNYFGGNGIQQAIDDVNNGDKILIKEGSYRPSNPISIIWRHLTIEGEGYRKTIISGGSLPLRRGNVFEIQGSQINLGKLQITDSIQNVGGTGILITPGSMVVGERKSDIRIYAVEIQNNSSHGIVISGGPEAFNVIRITNSLIHHNSIGIEIVYKADVEIVNSVIASNINHIITHQGTGIWVSERLESDSTIKIKNNIIANNSWTGGIQVLNSLNRVFNSYNLLGSNTQNYIGLSQGTGDLIGDARFATSNDYRVDPDSPAIHNGDPSLTNPDGTRSDIGAYGGPQACDLDPALNGCTNIIPSITPASISSPTPFDQNLHIANISLPDGRINSFYNILVRGYTPDINKSLYLEFTGLPSGIIPKVCYSSIEDNNKINDCKLMGYPGQSGTYETLITLSDTHDGITSKTLPLKINP